MQRSTVSHYLPSIGFLMKAAIGIALFTIIAKYVDINSALGRIGKADLGTFLLATGLILFQHVFAAARWCAVVEACGSRLPFGKALLAYVEANFFNQALPSTIGGDAVRVWRSSQAGLAFGPATVGVLLDRAFGLVTLAALALFGAVALRSAPGSQPAGTTLGVAAFAVIGGAIAGGGLSTLFPWLRNWDITRGVYWLSDGVKRVMTRTDTAIATIGHSLVGHLITVVAFQQLAVSLGIAIGFDGALKALPAILLASAIPLSVGGWGIRESAGIAIMPLLGLASPDEALALSLLLGVCLLLIGLLGGIVWLLGDTANIAQLRNSGQGTGEALRFGSRQNELAGEVDTNIVSTITDQGDGVSALSDRKRAILAHSEQSAAERDAWINANPGYFEDDRNYMRFLIPEGARVLELGCATGDLLARLKPAHGVGVDLSPSMIARARAAHPQLELIVGDVEDPAVIAGIARQGPFDYIVLSDTIGLLDDIERALGHLHALCTPETRLVIGYYSHLWEPAIFLAERLGMRPRQPAANFISSADFRNILDLADFEPIRTEWRQIVPKRLFGIGTFINRYIGTLPLIRRLCLRRYIVARSLKVIQPQNLSVSILIPCRNERGNIENAVKRLPRFGSHQEIVFIEGNSSDDTFAECLRVKEAYKDTWDITVVQQKGRGKGDAMRKGYATATGDVLMILDADLSVPPEMMTRFYDAIASGKGEFINGSRLVYPMQDEAMRPLNFIANRIFALLFSYLLNQRFTDTLCGTKVFRRRSYERIAEARSYLGDFDPFGDFDLVFGATKQSLRIVEVPVHYMARTYGETQISRFRDGLLLVRMVIFAWRKLKAI
jgi:uncharacterized membrane protein YbhN (UPF0104 family)/SAM-dependent methyltransferase